MFRNDLVDPEALSDAEKAIAEQVFKRLVRPGPGRDVVLKRLTLGELAAPAPGPGPTGRIAQFVRSFRDQVGRIARSVRSFRDQVLTPPGADDATPPGPEPPSIAAGEGEPPAAVGVVVRKLARAGLVRESGGAGEASFELANEALVDRWRRLADWVQDKRNEGVQRSFRLELWKRRVLWFLLVFSVALLIVVGIFWRNAEHNKQTAVIRQIAARAESVRRNDWALLLATRAFDRIKQLGGTTAFNRIKQRVLPVHREYMYPEARRALLSA